ncbi:hypothetical protein P3T36_001165 [Kitasatospora sp. MAP12-15]|uniref:hypothetical protein n=1 Tax=unclassified Kitasatospora TaxID=2633591 RepID=UPI0024757752|nr:hypothetical protein [Kitasatospora sp. MAP12-44]MDH6114814.1 hypothetical protein [Kitasatospora sp. MAP12-44]
MPETVPPGQLTAAQLSGEQCFDCGTADGPLHRGETITTPVNSGVVQDTTIVRCTPCVKARRTARAGEGS